MLAEEKGHDIKLSLAQQVDNFLLMYRSTPHVTTGVPPAELFLKRQLRTRFTLLKPSMKEFVQNKQTKQVVNHDMHGVKTRTFKPQDIVRVRSHRRTKEKWVAGTIIKIMGPETYLVRIGSRIRYVHVDHLIESGEDSVPNYDPVHIGDRLLPPAGTRPMPILSFCGFNARTTSANCLQ